MLSRSEFNKFTKQYEGSEPTVQEIEKLLEEHGGKLSLKDTEHILKEVYGIEIGDFILVKGDLKPSGAKKIIEDIFCFKLTDIRIENGIIYIFINNDNMKGNGYNGQRKSGIFYFFKETYILSVIPSSKELDIVIDTIGKDEIRRIRGEKIKIRKIPSVLQEQ